MAPHRLVLAALLLSACGPAAVNPDLLCGDAPESAQGALVTTAGCAYEQQSDNILHHGLALAAGDVLKDATGGQVGTAQYSCGRFVMGKDAQGVGIIVDTRSGAVRSHGGMHAGYPASSLPATVAAPVSH